MKNNIKLISLDMDGSSFHKAGGIVETNIEPIKACEKSGVRVVFVTGRPIISHLNEDIKKHGMVNNETLMVGFNGALIRKLKTGEIIFSKKIAKSVAEKVFELAKEYKGEVSLFFYLEDESKAVVNLPVKGDKCLEDEKRFFDGQIDVYENNSQLTDGYKFICKTSNQKFIHELEKLNLAFFGNLGKNSEVVDKSVSKRSALEFISEHWKISNKEMLSVGDGENDVPMLEYTDFSFAPSDANEAAKQAAKMVCDLKANEGAVAKILKDFVLEGE